MAYLSKDGKLFTLNGKVLSFEAFNPSTTLNDNTWEVIRAISDEGTGANYWQVGDTKTIVINGTVGKTTFNNLSIDCFILGFNHNAAKEGNNRIHFGIGKSGDKLVGLCDSMYGPDGGRSFVSETGYFSMNSSNTNRGGWKDCQLRNIVLQGIGTPASPTANTMLSALPSDLLAVLKSVTKYTDNVGGGAGSVESNVTATIDYLFIPATFEVITNDYDITNTYEQAQQQQYDYWKNGNSAIAYKYNDTSEAADWWLRSPYLGIDDLFCCVSAGGGVSGDIVRFSLAAVLGFCV